MFNSCGENIQSSKTTVVTYYVEKTGQQQQIIQHKMLNKAVYRERDINMDHLGPDRTIKFLQEKKFGRKIEGET